MTDHLAYDSFEVDEYAHFSRRAAEIISQYQDELDRSETPIYREMFERDPEGRPRIERELRGWRYLHKQVSDRRDEELSSKLQEAWRKHLFNLRWIVICLLSPL